MKIDIIIRVIQESNLTAEQKAELIKEIKFDKNKDKILTIIKVLGISAKIISLFKD